VKGSDINFKVEIWLDIREDIHTEAGFKAKEDQDKALAIFKQKFLEIINQSYEESKGTEPILKIATSGDIKFENHSSSHDNAQRGGGKGPRQGGSGFGGGYGGGGNRRGGRDRY